jgi:hypothetical protein
VETEKGILNLIEGVHGLDFVVDDRVQNVGPGPRVVGVARHLGSFRGGRRRAVKQAIQTRPVEAVVDVRFLGNEKEVFFSNPKALLPIKHSAVSNVDNIFSSDPSIC